MPPWESCAAGAAGAWPCPDAAPRAPAPPRPAPPQFMCPCHGSQYNAEGKKIRGPAPLSLALAHCDVVDDVVTFSTW